MSKKNEFQTKALAAVMTASMVTGMAPASIYAASGEQVAKDGTYTQTTHVKDGDEDGWSEYDVKVSLTVENGKFKDITVTPSESYNDESKTYLNSPILCPYTSAPASTGRYRQNRRLQMSLP